MTEPIDHASEIRALLLTDVVDSTQLSEQLGDAAMAKVWAAHDRVARDLLPRHGGREIDRTDGFLLLFDAAADAVAYALAYHRAIGALDPPLKARAGLHVGLVILTENAPSDVARGAKPLEVDGLAKPTAARVMSVAVGGQTLLTSEATAALGRTDLRVASHGHWRMKGVAEPLELFEVGGPDAPFVPPPDGAKVYRVVRQGELWLPAREVKHSLPSERDAFVGRQADLQDLARLLDDGAHLVSVLGLGGTGKTRLVTRFAWGWLGDFPGGAWFCDLSEARGTDGVVAAVARALDVPLGKDDPVVLLGHAIAGRGRCLVVLDNFEQVARHAPETLGKWLDRASQASFVVTTREVLGLPGETTLALAPLGGEEGEALFVARASQAKRDFVLTDAERPHVRALVKLLDGLPLAIELAAARVRLMAPKVLLERMNERFKLLASAGGRHSRQATLRATLDWSWELLTRDEQAALAQLSVFEGGFTLEAAEAVLSLGETWPADAVQALVDKSLVRREGDERFDLLVSVQEYAAERLGGGRDVAEERHGRWFATFGTGAAIEAFDTRMGTSAAFARDCDNLVVACRRAVARRDGEVAAAALTAACAVLSHQGPLLLAVELGEAVRGLETLEASVRARVDRVLGGALLDLHLGAEAIALFEDALTVAEELGDRTAVGRVLASLATAYAHENRTDQARASYEAALAIAREVRDRRTEGNVLANIGSLQVQLGQVEDGRANYEIALAVHREVGNRRSEGIVLDGLGILHLQQGRLDEARTHFEAALAVVREIGNRRTEGGNLLNLGYLNQLQGRSDEARGHLERALVITRAVGARFSESFVLSNLGIVHRSQGRPDEARAHFLAALEVARDLPFVQGAGVILGHLGDLDLASGRLADARDALSTAESILRPHGRHFELGMVLGRRARLEHAAGDPDVARRFLAEAEAVAREIGAGPDSPLGRELANARALLAEARDAPDVGADDPLAPAAR